MDDYKTHEFWMGHALKEAEEALKRGETPVGAVIVKEGKIIGKGGNRVETYKDPTAHAEIIAIGAASEETGYERLINSVMYVTLEPCPMCAGAIVLSRIPWLFYGAADPKMGACGTVYDICRDKHLNHQVEVISGLMESECASIIQEFFRSLRAKKKMGNDR